MRKKLLNIYTYIYIYIFAFVSFPILMKLEFSQQIFEKSSVINYHENPSSKSRDGRTDG